MKCVVLAGGGGLRLWPLSREKYPKQFLKLGKQNTLFQETILRNRLYVDSFLVVTNDEFRFIVEKEMEEIGVSNYNSILESLGRNTAPAITIASMLGDSDEILFVVPADAKIEQGILYEKAIEEALELAQQGYLVTFGIKPDSPHTGYGYIKYRGNDVEGFKEKPNLAVAKEYLEQGNYLWNSGMFMFRADMFLNEIHKYRADIHDACVSLCKKISLKEEVLLSEEDMLNLPAESVDYAVMEQSDKIKVVQAKFGWNDVGGFEALCEAYSADEEGNTIHGDHVIINHSENVSVINESADKIVVVNDIKDVIVVNTNDAVYITKTGRSSEIKKIIEDNKKQYSAFFESTIKNYRPWGYYEVLINNPGYKVKKITIYPGKRLSLQKHFYRSEHWTVVEGMATITLGTDTKEYKANESAYIPIGQIHRVANCTKEAVSIIEVALGEKVLEEDIVRIEDDFGR